MAPATTGATAVSALLWFRKGLRVHDSPALLAACAGAVHVYPVFCIDPWFVASGCVGQARLRFLAESLADLDASLRARGSRLIVLEGKPEAEIPRALEAWGCARLVYEQDEVEPYALERDASVRSSAATLGVSVVEAQGHTICELADLLAESKGEAVTTYSSFQNHFAKVVARKPIVLASTPAQIPPPGEHANGMGRAVPTVAEFAPSLAGSSSKFPGGETEALRRLKAHLALENGKWAAAFEKPQTSPTELDPFGPDTRSTTVLSPYLKFGCLSSRTFLLELRAATAAASTKSKPPMSLEGQILWREFYYACAKAVGPNFGQMKGNKICRQIAWRDVKTEPAAAEALKAWREGRTGYPWIDACMRQLASEGWIHHLARHAVACFLTRGDLWISWEEGAAVFDELLIDGDWALNNGNWMWLSCSCFFYQYFRCYSPVAFGKKYDPNGTFIRKYVPELANFPAKYIFEPWKAPIADQKTAGCRIGVDYPKPMVQHDVASKENMGKMAEAYKQHKEGAADAADAAKAAKGGAGSKPAGVGKSAAAPSASGGGKRPRSE